MIDKASDAGADAVKFQILEQIIIIQIYSGFKYLKKNTYSLIKSLEINRDWISKLKNCDKKR